MDKQGPRLTRVPGITLLKGMLGECQEKGHKVALFGTSEQNRQLASVNMKRIYPGLAVETVGEDYYDFGNDLNPQKIVDGLNEIGPHLAVMAATQIAAEKWINHWIVGGDSGVRVAGNFGQAIDIFAGTRRDFAFSREVGLEWFLRLALNTTNRRDKIRVLLAFGKMTLLDCLHP